MGNDAEVADSEIEYLLIQLPAELAAIDRAIARAEAPERRHRRARHREPEWAEVPGAMGPEGVVVADLSLKRIALDSGAKAILQDLNRQTGSVGHIVSLPAQIIDLIRARPRGDVAANFTRLRGRHNVYSCRFFAMHSPQGGATETTAVLHLRTEVSVTDIVRQVGADYRLTDREQKVLIGVSMGLTSKELAKRMHVSPNRVKACLHLIMVKMGARARAGVGGQVGGEPPN